MKFTKIHGAGNDFIIIDNTVEKIPKDMLPKMAESLCTRKYSVGADGIMFICKPELEGDFRMHFYNADGSEGEMCGNGVRCLSRFAFENNLAGEHQRIETRSGLVESFRVSKRNYKVRLNSPSIYEEDLHLSVDSKILSCSYVELGIPGLPHLIVEIPQLEWMPKHELLNMAKKLRNHIDLPKGANVNFYYIDTDGEANLRTYERGVEDFTLSCGTGAGSLAYSLYKKNSLEGNTILVNMPGGSLEVEIVAHGEDHNPSYDIYQTGPTRMVYDGNILYKEF